MQNYRTQYGLCPSVALVEIETGIRFPAYEQQLPFDFWFDEFVKYVKHGVLLEMLGLVEDYLTDGKVDEAVNCIGNTYAGLSNLLNDRKPTATLSELAHAVLEKHRLLQNGMVQEGIYTGFPYIDRVTGGAQPGDAWAIAGESGAGKSFTLCKCVMSAVANGKRCMFVSMEMPNMQMGRRSMAMGAEVCATSLRLGRLSRFGVEQIREFLRGWDDCRNERLLFVEGRVRMSVNDVKAKAKEFKPDAIFIDGAYMLRSTGQTRSRWEMNMEVMEDLKQFAMTENVAVIATFQFDQKQKLKGLATIMGGQSIGQLASVVIGIENEQSQGNFNGIQYKELTLYKGREGEKGKIRLRCDMNRTTIEQCEILEGDTETDRENRDDMGELEEF